MPRLRFEQLLPIYRATAFSEDGATGDVKVAAEEIKQPLVFIDGDGDARDDSGLGIRCDLRKLKLGDLAALTIQPPRTAIGRLSRDLKALLSHPDGRLASGRRASAHSRCRISWFQSVAMLNHRANLEAGSGFSNISPRL